MEEKSTCVEITKNGNKTIIIFKGNKDNRDLFLDASKDYLKENYALKYKNWTMFISLLYEITKNIYDHARGKGKMTLIETNEAVEFLIEDENTTLVDFSVVDLMGYSTGKRENHNIGIGMQMIKELGNCNPNIFDFKRDNSNGGVTYSGKFRKRKN